MRTVQVLADVPGRSADESFPLLTRMQDYPKFSETVLDLQVSPEDEKSSVSTWKVKFGPGTATWSQQDTFDAPAKTIRFHRLSGDIDDFNGSWTLRDTTTGCQAHFQAEFDTGLFLLAGVVEPMIENLLKENVANIFKGIFAPGVLVRS